MNEKVYIYKLNNEEFEREELQIVKLLSLERRKKAEQLKPLVSRRLSMAAGRLLSIAEAKWTSDKKMFSNISHSGEYAVVAVSDSPVGVDIEHKDDSNFRVTDRMLAEEDRRFISGSQERFRIVWTIKESFLKCTRQGIVVPLKDFTSDYEAAVEGRPARIIYGAYELPESVTTDSSYTDENFYTISTKIEDGSYYLTLCSQNPNISLDIQRVEVLL